MVIIQFGHRQQKGISKAMYRVFCTKMGIFLWCHGKGKVPLTCCQGRPGFGSPTIRMNLTAFVWADTVTWKGDY